MVSIYVVNTDIRTPSIIHHGFDRALDISHQRNKRYTATTIKSISNCVVLLSPVKYMKFNGSYKQRVFTKNGALFFHENQKTKPEQIP